MKALITGGSGFVGSVLAKALDQNGVSVRVFDLIDFTDRPQSIEFYKGDILNREDVEKALGGVDIVYHNVALVPLSKAGKRFWEVNVEGTRLILEVCRRKAIKNFIYTSSSAIFGAPQCPITSTTQPRPIEDYGRAKLAGEELVQDYISEGRTAVIIRPRTVLGDYRLGIFSILFEWIKENRRIYIIGNGTNTFQFIHVDDLIDAIIKAANLGRSGIFNIGTDHFGTLRDTLEEFIKKVGSNSRVTSIPAFLAVPLLRFLDIIKLSPLAPWHYLTYHKPFYFDVSEEMKVLKWKPRYSDVEALVSSYRWYLNNRYSIKRDGSTHHSTPKQKILKLLKWFS